MKQGRALGALLVPVVATAGLAGGCDAGPDDVGIEPRNAALVHGADDRRESFELDAPDERALMAGAAVALLPRAALRQVGNQFEVHAPTWGEVAGLCPGERFADQPAAAFCSGVLVDWDLVLTAGHCLRVYALEDFAVVFGYAYDVPGRLAVAAADVVGPVEIVAERLGPGPDSYDLDYAWLRLAHPVAPPRRPAPVRTGGALAADDPIVSIGSGGGVPLKWDAGGRVRDARAETADYFTASTDTAGGSSGGGAFDSSLALVGVMARGGVDVAYTDEGCARTVHLAEDSEAHEQFTYAARALEALCGARPEASTLCRPTCGEPCAASALPPAGSGCSMAGGTPCGGLLSLGALVVRTGRARRRWAGHSAGPRPAGPPRGRARRW